MNQRHTEVRGNEFENGRRGAGFEHHVQSHCMALKHRFDHLAGLALGREGDERLTITHILLRFSINKESFILTLL